METDGGAVSLGKSLAKLSDRHRFALSWFRDHHGKLVAWPPVLTCGSEQTLLACKPKGIYKPEWLDYALSIRETKIGDYDDRQVLRGGSVWTYEYHQEGSSSTLKRIFTNQGLVSCLRDAVPVGVIRQVDAVGKGKYLIQGLAFVEGFRDGYFYLRSAQNGTT